MSEYAWLFNAARSVEEKCKHAQYQTGDKQMDRTIINVDNDEATVLVLALMEWRAVHEHRADRR